MERWLIIPVEIKVREFDAKLLLARAACLAGFKVIFGERYAVQECLPSLPGGIYFGKDITRSVENLYRCIRDLGHTLVALDEEALVYYSRGIYRQRRFHPSTCAQTSALFAWGPDNAELWRESPGFSGVPIVESGNPRFDLLRPEFRYLYTVAAEALRARYGDFILVNTNFGHVNSFLPKFRKMPDPVNLNETLVARGGKLPHFYDPALAGHRNRIFAVFKEMLLRLAAAFPKRCIVLRPHPAENAETWRTLLAGHPNVEVLYEGAVTPWILAAQVLVHNGCTTAIEAERLGVPALAYRAVRDDAYEAALPNEISHQVSSFDELVESVGGILDGALDAPQAAQAASKGLAARFLSAGEGDFAVQRIAASLRALEPAPRPNPLRRMHAWATLSRQAHKSQRKRARIKDARRAWREHSFPPTSAAEVTARLEDFARGLPADRPLKVSELGANLFQIIETANS